jgi:plastocyanin
MLASPRTRKLLSALMAIPVVSATAALLSTSAGSAQNQVPAAHGVPNHRLQIINMDIDFRPKTRPSEGKLSGYDPVIAVVHTGDRVQFVNTDDIRHTATGYAFGGPTIPENYKFQGDPSMPHGDMINASEWSTGTVPAHGRSKIFNTGPLGTFYYACAYHQGQGMRGVIIVKP